MKTHDWWFLGFPAVWNVVVFYIVVFLPPAWLALVIVVALTAMMFLPVVFVHPVRVKRWRPMTMAVLVLWSIAAVWSIIVDRLAPGMIAKGVLLAEASISSGSAFCAICPRKSEAHRFAKRFCHSARMRSRFSMAQAKSFLIIEAATPAG